MFFMCNALYIHLFGTHLTDYVVLSSRSCNHHFTVLKKKKVRSMAMPPGMRPIPSDVGSYAGSGLVSTCVRDHLGRPGAGG